MSEMIADERTFWNNFCWLRAEWLRRNSSLEYLIRGNVLHGMLIDQEVQEKIKLMGLCYRDLEKWGAWEVKNPFT